MRKITAAHIYPVSSEPLENAVLITDDAGKILALERAEDHDPASLERYDHGVLVPGFVNTHCHLELSHMLGRVDTGTGLIPFITGVVMQRNMAAEVIADAVQRAEAQMLEAGIVACGDISNTRDTFAVKEAGRMRWYTFVELFDFLQDAGAEKAFGDWKPVYDDLKLAPGSAKALVPHAPYSVSPTLFSKINAANCTPADAGASAYAKASAGKKTISIHNQETPPENDLFMFKTGGFLEFYGRFGISLDHFEATGKPSIYYALQHLDPAHRTLFVHNTLTTRDDIEAARAWNADVYWATCPNANLYIENRLPNYRYFLDADARVTIGTDSLTSNWQLSVLEEMKTIARFQSYVPFDTLLRWATLNGAEALGFDDTLGSFDTGKTPGVLLLENFDPGQKLTERAGVKRLL